MRVCSTVVAVLAMASFASGAVVVNVTNLGSPLPGYTAYQVDFEADAQAERVTAFQGRFDGVMHQVWPWVGFPLNMHFETVTDGVAAGTDSTLLLKAADLVAVAAPHEEPPPLPAGVLGEGDTTWIANDAVTPMGFSVQLTAYTDAADLVLEFAYLVVPDGDAVVLTGEISKEGQGTQVFDLPQTNIPEPLTLSLIGLGGLALLRRRR